MGIGPNVQNRAMGELKHPKDFFSKKRVTEERNAKEILQELKRAMIVHAQVIKSICLQPSHVVFNTQNCFFYHVLLSCLQGCKKDRYDKCGEWKTCCPDGDGSGALCVEEDCADGASICQGHWMKEHCPQTCDICISNF